MCLLAFAYQLHPDYPLILIANRDEFYARPTGAARWWPDSPDILGGQDLEAGGSWLAVQRDGRFAAVTNHRDGRQARTGALSRGKLIRDFLGTTVSPDKFCTQLEPTLQQYGGFNLLLGGPNALVYLSNRGGGCHVLSPGLYGLSNAFLDTPWPKTVALKSRLATYLEHNPIPAPEALLTLLMDRQQAADHALPDTGIRYEWEKMLSSCFIQSSSEGYGTRASTVVLVHRSGERTILEQNFDAQGATEQRQYHLTD